MDILVECLGTAIQHGLGDALAWKALDGNQPPSTSQIGSRKIGDDGQELRIQASKPEILQIIKWFGFTQEPRAILSDGISQVNARFSTVAAHNYQKEHKRRLTDGTLGGLLQLTDFDIVANHSGARADRITLHIAAFKSLGSNGSEVVGRTLPHQVHSLEIVKELLSKLAMLREHEIVGDRGLSRTERPSESPSFDSQPGDPSSGEDAQPASQCFATQAPVSKRPGPRASELGVKQEVTSISAALNGIRPIASNIIIARPKNLLMSEKQPLRDQNEPPAAMLNGKKLPVSNAEALVNLLPKQKKIPIPMVGPKTPGVLTTASVSEIGSRLAPTQITPSMQESSHDSNNCIGQPARQRTEILIPSIANIPDQPSIDIVSTIPAKRKSRNQYQAEVRNRISSRDVRITKDQEDLLNCKDSWIPAEPGHREPLVNVPISILELMSQNADSHASRSSTPLKNTRGDRNAGLPVTSRRLSLHCAANESWHESESDIPVSSGQWPASPDRNQLPPDSSASTTNPDDSPHKASAQITSDIKRRRHSGTPISAALSPRPISRLSIETSRLSKETSSGPMSPSLVSPSIVSTSAGEEIQSYKCERGGCGKVYKDARALKYHVDRHHADKGTVQMFRCTVEDCNKSYPSPGGLKYHEQQRHNGKQPHVGQKQSEFSSSRASTPVMSRLDSANRDVVESEVSVSGDQERHVPSFTSTLTPAEMTETAPLNANDSVLPQEDLESSDRLANANNGSHSQHSQPADNKDLLSAQSAPSLINGAQKPDGGLLTTNSRSASPESDLETAVPLPLHEYKDLLVNAPPPKQVSSTASQSDAPFTQVKRTPYVNGHIQDYPSQSSGFQTSPSKLQNVQSPQSTLPEDITHISASISSTLAVSSAGITVPNTVNNVTSSHVSEDDEHVEPDKNAAAHAIQADVDAQKIEKGRGGFEGRGNQGNGPDFPVQHGVTDSKGMAWTAEMEGTGNPVRTFDAKRKCSDPNVLSRNVAKRQKKSKIPFISNFKDIDDGWDLNEEARRYRLDFMASRNNDERDTLIQSPSEPLEVQMRGGQPGFGTRAAVLDIDKNEPMVQDLDQTEGGMNITRKTVASPNLIYQLDENFLLPSLGPNLQGQAVDRPCNGSANSGVESALQMLNGDPQSSPAPTATPNVVSAIHDSPIHIHMDIDEASPRMDDQQRTDDHQPTSTPASGSARGPKVVDSQDPSHGSEEPWKLLEFQPASFDSNPQIFGRGELSAGLLAASASHTVSHDPHSRDIAALASQPPLEGTRDGNVVQDLESNLEPPSSEPVRSKKLPFLKQNLHASVSGSAFADQIRTGALATNIAPLSVSTPNTNTSTQLSMSVHTREAESITGPAPKNIFEQFKARYPAYPGDIKQFAAICRKISSLCKSNRMEHQSLWDDFIIRHRIEYGEYVLQCAEDAEDPLPYEDFYRNEIEEPLYRSRVVTRRNLDEVLTLLAPNMKRKPKKAEQRQICQANNRDTKQPVRSEPQLTVDLTGDSEESAPSHAIISKPEQLPTSSRKNTRRSIPWLESGSIRRLEPSGDVSSATSQGLVAEKVRGMSALDPIPLPQANAAEEIQDASTHDEWWQDQNAPFKLFARAYASIQPGEGNSYATAGSIRRREVHNAEELQGKMIDVLGWSF